jgi:hypothetical protein
MYGDKFAQKQYAVAFIMGMSHEIVAVYQCILGGEEEEHEEEGGPTDHEGPDHHRHHCRYPKLGSNKKITRIRKEEPSCFS